MSEHRGVIESSFTEDEYQSICDCGWKGHAVAHEDEARAELSDHYKESL